MSRRQDVINSFRIERENLCSKFQKLKDDIDILSEDTIFSLELIHKFIPLCDFNYSDYVNLLNRLLNKLENITLTRKWSDKLNDKILVMMKKGGSMSLLTKLECEYELEDEIRIDPGEIKYQNGKERIFEIKRQCENLIIEYSYIC